ncbi:MAG: hypothetical protein ABSA84_01300 [Gammaproteobacteria bacterium]
MHKDFDIKNQHSKLLLEEITVILEAFWLSHSYAKAPIETHLRYQGINSQVFYACRFKQILCELIQLGEEIENLAKEAQLYAL